MQSSLGDLKELFEDCSLSKREPCWPPSSAHPRGGQASWPSSAHLRVPTGAHSAYSMFALRSQPGRGGQPTRGFNLAKHHRHHCWPIIEVDLGKFLCPRNLVSLHNLPSLFFEKESDRSSPVDTDRDSHSPSLSPFTLRSTEIPLYTWEAFRSHCFKREKVEERG